MTLTPEYIYKRMNPFYQNLLQSNLNYDYDFYSLLTYLIKSGYDYSQIRGLFNKYAERKILKKEFQKTENNYFQYRSIIDLIIDYICYQLETRKIILSNNPISNKTDIVVLKTLLSTMKYRGKLTEVYCPIREIHLITGRSKSTIVTSLKRLKGKNLIKVVEFYDQNKMKNNKRLNFYEFNIFEVSNALYQIQNIYYKYSISEISKEDNIIYLFRKDYIYSTGEDFFYKRDSEIKNIEIPYNESFSILEEFTKKRSRLVLSEIYKHSEDIHQRTGLSPESKKLIDFINSNQNRLIKLKEILNSTNLSHWIIISTIEKLKKAGMIIIHVKYKGYEFRSKYNAKIKKQILINNKLSGRADRRLDKVLDERYYYRKRSNEAEQ